MKEEEQIRDSYDFKKVYDYRLSKEKAPKKCCKKCSFSSLDCKDKLVCNPIQEGEIGCCSEIKFSTYPLFTCNKCKVR